MNLKGGVNTPPIFKVMNMRKFIYILAAFTFMCFVMSLFISCSNENEWEIKTEIQPQILGQDGDDELYIQYNLGPFIILDDLDYMKASHQQYVLKQKNVKLNLYVSFYAGPNNGFYYYVGGIKLGVRTNPMKLKKLQERADEIPGFKWLTRDGKKIKGDSIIESEVINGSNDNQLKRLE